MVFVNKELYLGHEKDVSCVKQGSEMSNRCLRQDQGFDGLGGTPPPKPWVLGGDRFFA